MTEPVQCLDVQEQDELRLAEDRTMSAAWDELEALLVANERRHKLGMVDVVNAPETRAEHAFEAEQWTAVRRLLDRSCGVLDPADDTQTSP